MEGGRSFLFSKLRQVIAGEHVVAKRGGDSRPVRSAQTGGRPQRGWLSHRIPRYHREQARRSFFKGNAVLVAASGPDYHRDFDFLERCLLRHYLVRLGAQTNGEMIGMVALMCLR